MQTAGKGGEDDTRGYIRSGFRVFEHRGGGGCSMSATVKVIPSSPPALARICSINEGWQTVTGGL